MVGRRLVLCRVEAGTRGRHGGGRVVAVIRMLPLLRVVGIDGWQAVQLLLVGVVLGVRHGGEIVARVLLSWPGCARWRWWERVVVV